MLTLYSIAAALILQELGEVQACASIEKAVRGVVHLAQVQQNHWKYDTVEGDSVGKETFVTA